MGLEELKREIIAQAEANARSVVDAARREAQRIAADATAESQRKRDSADAETRRLLDAVGQRELAASALEAKKLVMAAKKEVLDEVFADVAARLAKLPAAERKAFVAALVKRAATEIQIETVYCNPKDKEFVAGHKTGGAEIMGGVITENKDATVRVDYSFETMLDEVRERSLEELGRIVFKA